MARTYRVADVTEELKRQIVVEDLLKLGVTSFRGKSVHDMNYREAKNALVMARVKENF